MSISAVSDPFRIGVLKYASVVSSCTSGRDQKHRKVRQ